MEYHNLMRATVLLQRQLEGLNDLFHRVTDDLTDREWTTRAFAGANLIGFPLWHSARTQDCVVQVLIRGLPSIATSEGWINRAGFNAPGIGDTLTLSEADQLACRLSRTNVIAYADRVHQILVEWLQTITDSDLDTIPNAQANYDQVSYPDKHPSLFGKDGTLTWACVPIWQLLTKECVMHVRNHLIEAEMLTQVMRKEKA